MDYLTSLYLTDAKTGEPKRRVGRPNLADRNAEIIRKYEEGVSVVTLGEEYGLTRERVCQLLRPHNLTNYRAEQRRLAREAVEAERAEIIGQLKASRADAVSRAVEIVRSGKSRNDAIRETKLPPHIVQQACREANLPHHHGRWMRDSDFRRRRQRVLALRAEGKTWAKIEEITKAEGDRISYPWINRNMPEVSGSRVAPHGAPKQPTIKAPQPKPRTKDIAWTPEQVGRLCKMYFDGCSAQQIADVLGSEFTRNSVIGKTNRLRAVGLLKPPA